MSWRHGCLSAVLLAIAISSASAADDPAAQTKTDSQVVRLGFAAPLSGPQAHFGQDMLNGVELAVEEANAQGITLDGQAVQFALRVHDDKADSRVALTVAHALTQENVSGVLGHFNSGPSIAASQVYADAGIPQMAMATAPQYNAQGYDSAFRMMTSDTQQGSAIGQFVVKDLGARAIVLIEDRSAYGQGLAQETTAAVEAAGGKVVHKISVDRSVTDFTPVIQTLQNEKFDLVFFGGSDIQAGPLRRQLVSHHINVPFIVGEMARSDVFVRLAGEAAEGAYGSLAGVPLNRLEEGIQFQRRFHERYGVEPGVYAPYAYDGAWSLITAMQEAGSAEPRAYLPYLHRLQRKGVTSARLSYRENGDLREVAVTLYQVDNGRWKVYKTLVKRSN